MNKNSYASNNSRIYIQQLFVVRISRPTYYSCNLLYSRAEILGNWEIVRKAKLLDFRVSLLSDQIGCMRHLCVRALNSSSRHVSFSLLFTGNYLLQTYAGQIGKLKCYVYVIRLVLKRLSLSIEYS